MTVKSVILLILGGVLANNLVFESFLGVTPLLGFARRGSKMLAMGLAVTVTEVLCTAVLYPLQGVLNAAGLGFLQVLVYAAVILILVYVLEALSRLIFRQGLGVCFPIIALNSAVLGLAVKMAGAESFVSVLLTALGVGLGFLAALFVFAGVREKIDETAVPKAFRGLPVELLAACIISMALLAFK